MKEKRFYNILSIVLFIPGSILMWEVIRELCHIIGSIVCGDIRAVIEQVKRMAPLYLAAFIFVYLACFLHAAFTAKNQEKRAKIWNVNGIVTVFLGIIQAALVLAYIATGKYEKLVEGYIYPLFPLDMLILGIAFVAYGIFGVKYSGKIAKKGSAAEYFDKGVNPFANIARVLSYIVTMCSFAAVVMSPVVVDWAHGYIFYNIMLCISFLTPVVMAALYRFGYFGLEKEKRPGMQVLTAALLLVMNILVLVLYTLSVQLQPDAPGQNAFAVLPVEFTASFNAFPLIYGANNILAPLAALVRGLIRKKKLK